MQLWNQITTCKRVQQRADWPNAAPYMSQVVKMLSMSINGKFKKKEEEEVPEIQGKQNDLSGTLNMNSLMTTQPHCHRLACSECLVPIKWGATVQFICQWAMRVKFMEADCAVTDTCIKDFRSAGFFHWYKRWSLRLSSIHDEKNRYN